MGTEICEFDKPEKVIVLEKQALCEHCEEPYPVEALNQQGRCCDCVFENEKATAALRDERRKQNADTCKPDDGTKD